ncbi:MAG: hypothetical protein AAGA77_19650 [Bacteroidota bacterium]
MKLLKSLKVTMMAVVLTSIASISIGQQTCIEVCLKDCEKEERKCIEKAMQKWNECYFKCREKYPHWSDNGYYGDACYEVCDEEFEEALSECIFYGDLCIDVCEQLDEDCLCDDCPDGFNYNTSSDKCEITVTDPYEIVIIDDKIYLQSDCSDPAGCCPDGWESAWDQFCTKSTLKDECQDRIDEINDEAASDAAQGDPIDWNYINSLIDDILNDPDCYITEEIEDCDPPFCTKMILKAECKDRIADIEDEAAADEAQGDPIDWNYINGLIDDILNDPDCYDIEKDEDCDICLLPALIKKNIEDVDISGNKISIKPSCN